MSLPENSYEEASYQLTQFRERRMKERRTEVRSSADRRAGRADKAAVSSGAVMVDMPDSGSMPAGTLP
ncbi:MAG: hypothetical protein ACTHL1_07635 [Burkholderiaceae bacterium]